MGISAFSGPGSGVVLSAARATGCTKESANPISFFDKESKVSFEVVVFENNVSLIGGSPCKEGVEGTMFFDVSIVEAFGSRGFIFEYTAKSPALEEDSLFRVVFFSTGRDEMVVFDFFSGFEAKVEVRVKDELIESWIDFEDTFSVMTRADGVDSFLFE